MAAKISISIPDPGLLAWAESKAKRERKSLSAVFTELARRERQNEALDKLLEWAGPASKLTPEREAEIRAELSGESPPKRKAANGASRKRKR